jgi:hypothetical protein
MDTNEELEETFMKGGGKDSFFSYMFSLSSTEKNEMINLVQYILLVIIPVTILLKLMKTYIPLDNPKKASIEILIEVILQLVITFSFFWLIHKMVMFIPTYSGSPYPRLNIIQLVIPVFFLLICMKTSLSEKVSILLERVLIAVGLMKEVDEDEDDKKKKKRNDVNPMLPQQNSNFISPPMNTMRETAPQQQNINFQQNMDMAPPPYAMAGGYGIQEPMAANESGVTFLNF